MDSNASKSMRKAPHKWIDLLPELIELRKQGKTLREIAVIYNTSHQVIDRVLDPVKARAIRISSPYYKMRNRHSRHAKSFKSGSRVIISDEPCNYCITIKTQYFLTPKYEKNIR